VLLAISTDHVWCHSAFARAAGLTYPLLADAHPHGVVSRAYGVYDEQTGVSAHALRPRRARHHPVGLYLSSRHQSGRRRHPHGAGGAGCPADRLRGRAWSGSPPAATCIPRPSSPSDRIAAGAQAMMEE
jgi:hypothetical protein